jgi:vacuolar protein sorting-associated protein 13A/C
MSFDIFENLIIIYSLGYYERTHDRYTITKLTKEVSSHYQNQFMKQIHVLVLGLDVLGNPFGVIRGLAAGVESFFYEPYKVRLKIKLIFIFGFCL